MAKKAKAKSLARGKARRPAANISAARKSAPRKSGARTSAPRNSAARKSGHSAPRKSAPAPRPAPQPKWKPAGMHDLVAGLVFKNAAAAIEFYKTAFGAREQSRMMSPDGRSVWHAELQIGDSTFFLNDEMPQGSAVVAPGPDHKPTVTLQLYVPDCDALVLRAVQAGARPGMPVAEMFWGDRMGSVTDPFGQSWMISTRVRTLTPGQMRKAGADFAEQMKQQGGMPKPEAPPPNTDH